MLTWRRRGLAANDLTENLAVASFDDIPAALLLQPASTRLGGSEQAIWPFAAELLSPRLDGSDARESGRAYELPFQRVLSDSARPPGRPRIE